MTRSLSWFLFFLLIGIQQSLAQVDTARVVRDTTLLKSSLSSDSVADSSSTTSTTASEITPYKPTKKPWLAVGLSAAIPGLGQIYNGSYWKTPVILGLGGYWVSEWIKLNNRYKDYREQFAQSVHPSSPDGDNTLLQLRNFYRDERDKFTWYLGVLYFINLVDAYVGANLYDFDVSPDLGADGRIVPRATATIRVRF